MSYYAEWAKIYDATFDDTAVDTVIDTKGNVIVIGKYQTDYYNPNKPFNIEFGSSKVQKLNSGLYVIKYNNVGVIQWVTFIVEGPNRNEPNDYNLTRVQVDSNDNIYVTGYSFNYPPGISINTSSGIISSSSSYVGYFVKLDSTGVILWGKIYDNTYINNITIDINGNSYITGEVSNVGEDLSFITSSGTVTRPNYGFRNSGSFVVKHNADGEAIWAKFIDMTYINEYGVGITSDNSGYIYQLISTTTMYPIKIDTASGPFYSTKNITYKHFIIKYDANTGAIMYASQFNPNVDSSETRMNKLIFDPTTSRLYSLMQTTNWNNPSTSIITSSGTIVSPIYTSIQSNKQVWLLYFDSETLQAQWAYLIDGAYDETIGSLSVDKDGKVYVLGTTTTNNLTFQTSSGPVVNKNDNGNATLYLLRFLKSGEIDWAMFYYNNCYQYGSSISTDIYGNFFISGYTSSSSYITVSGYRIYNSSGYFIETSSGKVIRPYDRYSNSFLIKLTSGPSAYSSTSISPLSLGSTYYIRSAVQNATGIEYSPSTYIYKHIIYGYIQIKSIGEIRSNNIQVTFQVSSLGGDSSATIGIVSSYSVPLPTINPYGGYIDGDYREQVITSIGDYFFFGIGDLSPNTDYYLRPFIITSRGINYGDVRIVRTIVATTETSTDTGNITGITNTQATVNVRLSNVGGQNSYFGFVYSSTNPQPTIADSYFETPRRFPRNDAFELNVRLSASIYLTDYGYGVITGLSPNTVYYIRSFGRNDAGYNYNTVVYTFKTLPNLPTLDTTSLISINYK